MKIHIPDIILAPAAVWRAKDGRSTHESHKFGL